MTYAIRNSTGLARAYSKMGLSATRAAAQDCADEYDEALSVFMDEDSEPLTTLVPRQRWVQYSDGMAPCDGGCGETHDVQGPCNE